MEHNDAVLLVIVPAAQSPEISSSRALKLAKEFDADGGLQLHCRLALFAKLIKLCFLLTLLSGTISLFF